MRKTKCAILIILGMAVSAVLFGESLVDIKGSVEWDKMEINVAVALNLGLAGIRFPTGRTQAEELINAEYPQLIRPSLLSIPVDSSSTVEDLINQGELSLNNIGNIVLTAKRVPPALSPDLSLLSASYTIDLNRIGAELIRHSHPIEIKRPLISVPAASYTGIIIIASKELPIHGKNTKSLVYPCVFPKVWDTRMNLIYERNMMEQEKARKIGIAQYASESSIFRPTPSGLSPELARVVGNNPLRIIARGVYGMRPTDPIIDREDALIILSSDENIRYLREGRVAIVLSERVLKNLLIQE
jgi:hypothetical protein